MNSKILARATLGLAFLFVFLVRAARQARKLRRQEAQLREMSARELADLGIGASQIPWVVDRYNASSRSKNER